MMKKIAVALVAAGGLLVAAAPAHAGGHVSLSLGIGLPVGGYAYAPPAPAYYGPPQVVYTAPAPVYAAPVYYAPRYPGPRWYGPRYDAPRVVYRPGPRHGWDDHRGDDRRDWRR